MTCRPSLRLIRYRVLNETDSFQIDSNVDVSSGIWRKQMCWCTQYLFYYLIQVSNELRHGFLESLGWLQMVFCDGDPLIVRYDLAFSYEVPGSVFFSSSVNDRYFMTTLSNSNNCNPHCGEILSRSLQASYIILCGGQPTQSSREVQPVSKLMHGSKCGTVLFCGLYTLPPHDFVLLFQLFTFVVSSVAVCEDYYLL